MSFACPIFVPGGTYFFTVRLQDPTSDLLIRHIDLLRLSVRLCQQQLPFDIRDAVILPNRLHMIWDLPQADTDYGARWRMIKATFTRHLPRSSRPAGRGGGAGIWQRRYWEHAIVDARDLSECVALIAAAPVDAGLVAHAADWPYATATRRRPAAAKASRAPKESCVIPWPGPRQNH